MHSFYQDVRFGLRTLRRTPTSTAAAVITLALGIGANTAIFTAVNDFLLRPLPFGDPGRLVAVTAFERQQAISGWASAPDFRDWRSQNRVFTDMSARYERAFNVTGGAEPERIAGMEVTASFFPVLGVTPILGRDFRPAEDRPGGAPVAIVSHAFWQRQLGGNPGILGQSVTLDGKRFTVIGVMPAGFRFSNAMEDVWICLRLNPANNYRGSTFLKVLARLRPGVTVRQAQAEMNAIAGRLRSAYPQSNTGRGVTVELLHDRLVSGVRPALIVLMAMVGLVLLIACANVANLLLARATGREREIAIRRAVGAAPGRIVRQMLTESAVLAAAAGAAGFVLAVCGVRLLYAAIPEGMKPLSAGGVNFQVFGFTLATCLGAGVLFGLAPAFLSSRSDMARAANGGSSAWGGRSRTRLRGWLVISEVALAMILLTGGGVLIRSFVRLASVDPGFRPGNILTLRMTHQQRDSEFYRQAIEKVTNLPGVTAAGITSRLPMTGQDWGQNIFPEGRPAAVRYADQLFADTRIVSSGYFHAIGMSLRRGRAFSGEMPRPGPPECVINEALARRVWPGEDPIGKRFKIGDPRTPDTRQWNTVIGVVRDSKRTGLAEPAAPEMYFQGSIPGMSMVVRGSAGPESLAAAVRAAVRSIDPNQPISDVRLLDRIVSESIAPQRVTMALAALFSVLALVLVGTGLYGVIAHSVAQRTQEIGIRIALGARGGQVLRLVVRQAMALVAIGFAIGAAGALAATRLLASLLFEVGPRDPATIAAVSILLAAVALAASWLPARRAAQVDPAVALRSQ
jgi:putative ABC transport system permease protein